MTLDMTWLAFAVVIFTALVLGVVVQAYTGPKTDYEWLITAVGVSFGAWLASEYSWSSTLDLGPTWEGILIIPAVVGGIVIGGLFEAVARVVEPAPTPA